MPGRRNTILVNEEYCTLYPLCNIRNLFTCFDFRALYAYGHIVSNAVLCALDCSEGLQYGTS
eukprot:SAG31_NODE_483_length_15042_cov_28.867764_8_plen_62_part_00